MTEQEEQEEYRILGVRINVVLLVLISVELYHLREQSGDHSSEAVDSPHLHKCYHGINVLQIGNRDCFEIVL